MKQILELTEDVTPHARVAREHIFWLTVQVRAIITLQFVKANCIVSSPETSISTSTMKFNS